MLQKLAKFTFWKKKEPIQDNVSNEKIEHSQEPTDEKDVAEIEITNNYLNSDEQKKKVLSPNLILVKSLKIKIAELPTETKNIPFDKMELSVRAANTLSRENVITPEDLLNISDEEIIKWPAWGQKSIQDVLDAVILAPSLKHSSTKFILSEETESLLTEKGQILKDPNLNTMARLIIEQTTVPYDWLSEYFSLDADAKNIFEQAEINSDLSYISKRSLLPDDLVMAADTFRFNTLIKQIDEKDPLSVLNIAPEWLLNMEVFYFECGTRNKNIIKSSGIERLVDLCKLTLSDLMRMPNMGRKSVQELSTAIINAQAKGPPPKADDLNQFKGDMKENFFSSLEKIKDERQRFIIEERLGVNGTSKTLDEIGENIGITRERVRQIQKKVIGNIIDGEFWDDVLRMKLKDILKTPTAPLYLSKISEHDPWFDGFSDNVNLLQKIFEHFAHIKPQFLHLKNEIIITQINNDTWESIKSALLDSFEYSLDLHYTLEDIEMLIEHELATKKAKELSTLMFDEIFPLLNFSLIEGEMVLVSIGNSIGSYLKALLEQEKTPLHYSKIRDLYEQKYGITLSARNIHARLSYGGFLLFGRGVFGVGRHLKFIEEQQSEIIKFCEEFLEENSHRQCHAQEIIKIISETPLSQNVPKLDKFVLNILLANSDRLSYLGKMVWIYGSGEGTDTERLHIRKTVADILRKKGKAMRIEEIEKEITKVRSVGVNFSVNLQPNELFSRVDPATWGLLDRDFILPPKEWRGIKDFLYQHFEKNNKGLHTSELHDLVENLHLDTQITLGHIVGVLSSDDRFKKWRGGLIGLSSWSEPNRVTLSEALDILIDKNAETISTDMLEGKIENILGYNFEKNRVSMYLNKNGFSYNRKENIWKKAS